MSLGFFKKFSVLILVMVISQSTFLLSQNYVKSGDVNIFYTDQGEGDKSLVFLHAWSSDSSSWKHQIKFLKKEHRVITIDLPGFGRSGNNRTNWTMNEYGKDVLQVLKKLKVENPVLIGHSMGVYVSLEAAIIGYPGLLGVVSVDMLKNVEKFVSENEIDEGQKRARKYMESLDRGAPTIGWIECYTDAMKYKNKLTSVLKRISVPIHCICSDKAPMLTNIAQKYHSAFSADIIKNTGHGLMNDAPQIFNKKLLEWIEKLN